MECKTWILVLNMALFAVIASNWGIAGAQGNTFYVPDNCANLQACFALMSGGDTLIIRNGTYTGDNNRIHLGNLPPSGTGSAYTTIKAENPGKVIFDGQNTRRMLGDSGSAVYTLSHVIFEGIEWVNSDNSGQDLTGTSNTELSVHHIKFLKCGFEDNIAIQNAEYILLEDCYSTGKGRYNFIAYDSEKIIFRRCVARLDRANGGGLPVAHFCSYGSQDVEFQNCIAIDSDSQYYDSGQISYLMGGYYIRKTHDEKGESNTNNKLRSSILLNVKHRSLLEGFAWSVGYGASGLELENCVFWDMDNCYINDNSVDYEYTINHCTFGLTTPHTTWPWNAAFIGSQYGNNEIVTNSILYGSGEHGIYTAKSADYNCWYNNAEGNYYDITTVGSNNIADVNPITGSPGNGNPALKYLPRIEIGSDLDGSASDGMDIGATILTKIGVSGTLYNEPGYNTDTGESLWPWPYEDSIKIFFRNYGTTSNPNPKRGFCANGNGLYGGPITLTSYIWEYLGNPCPPEICNYGTQPDCDADNDGYNSDSITCGGNDCDDNNATINPGATEVCGNGIDENCDGSDLSCNITAFPGAEGAGAYSIGGRGGQVIKVTNLNDNGPGSFRAAVEASGPRIVVFEVSGIINLSSPIWIENPYITIAGQTSPGGIMINNYGVFVRASDVIIQHMRFAGRDDQASSLGIWGDDSSPPSISNIIIDHCSIRWNCDECGETAYNPTDITISWCIIGPGLEGCHPEGEGNHNMGFLVWGKYSPDTKISFHHNYFTHNNYRNPEATGTGNDWPWMDGWNNVVFDFYGSYSTNTGGYVKINWRHNYCKRSSVSNSWAKELVHWTYGLTPQRNLFVEGNLGCYRTSQSDPQWSVSPDWQDEILSTEWQAYTPWEFPGLPPTITVMSASYADTIVNNAGATKPFRDSADELYVQDYYNTVHRYLSSSDVVYPSYPDIPPPSDNDNDGMADTWELSEGLNTAIDDSALDKDGDGYTNIEEYLHYLSQEDMPPPPTCENDNDGDGYGTGSNCLGPDCNDNNPDINPGTAEVCGNGVDDDCDNSIDCDDSDCSCAQTYSVKKTLTAPTIDGDIAEFNTANEIHLTAPETGTMGIYRLMWDDTALYIAASVSDTELNAVSYQEDGELWKDDSIEMMFDTLHNAGASQGPDDYKFMVNINDYHLDSNQQDSSWDTTFYSQVIPLGTINNNADTDNGYTIEISIPWANWGIAAPSENEAWGFDLVLEDRDENGTRHNAPWSDTTPGGLNDPDGWGDAVFLGSVSIHPADNNPQDGCITMGELSSFIGLWKLGSVPMPELMEAISLWKSGAGCS